MPESVKISELPVLASVASNDVVPIVDAAFTQTSRCTASQIAAIGGGPPGDNTVTTSKIVNGAVLAAKTGFTATDRILGRASAGAGNGEEITCTAFARSLLDDADAAAARTTLGALQSTTDPTFSCTVTISGNAVVTGIIRNAIGSQSAPSYTFTGDTDTGVFSPGANNVSVTTGGIERFRIDGNGAMFSPIIGDTVRLPHFACRAWINFSGTVAGSGASQTVRGSGNVSSVVRQGSGTGVYTINFATSMPDANYCVNALCEWRFGDPYGWIGIYDERHYGGTTPVQTANYVTVIVNDETSPPNRERVMVSIFR
jgi:hypothetical protein